MHPLRGTVRRLCKMAGFSGFYSNHSLRATTATTAAHLYDHDSGLEEQLTTEKTGHASLAIRSLKRTSAEMEARVDGVFQRKSTEPETAPTSTISALTSTDEMHCGAAS
ncbi:uncharacterized protein LOC124266002 [Haliotis rubra]|uniref:uncharacterized protein LOC124266002 n=1 Tax=Haliotis rubra TaxID=36100 RepID=UPI001EE58FDC|nr:uncharacterized protein LOC124266002 [Haliotis rubra]